MKSDRERKISYDIIFMENLKLKNDENELIYKTEIDSQRMNFILMGGGEDWGRVVREFPRRQWQPTPVLLPRKSHGQRSRVGCSPWGCRESDMTERFHFHFSLSCIGEGNGNPLQCSCLENSRDGGAWWAAIYGVAQSRT